MSKPKTPLAIRLTALFKNDLNPRWERDEAYFQPCSAGRRVCQLSAKATEFLIENLRGHGSKDPTYILIEPEGDIRLGGIQVFGDWPLVVKIALDEGVYIYNARSKKCCRPIWSQPLDERTLDNMSFEPIRLVADKKAYNSLLPKKTTVLFDVEEGIRWTRR